MPCSTFRNSETAFFWRRKPTAAIVSSQGIGGLHAINAQYRRTAISTDYSNALRSSFPCFNQCTLAINVQQRRIRKQAHHAYRRLCASKHTASQQTHTHQQSKITHPSLPKIFHAYKVKNQAA